MYFSFQFSSTWCKKITKIKTKINKLSNIGLYIKINLKNKKHWKLTTVKIKTEKNKNKTDSKLKLLL